MSVAGCSQSVATVELCLLALLGLPTNNGLLSSNCWRPADSSASKLPGAVARWAAANCSTAEAKGCSLQASTAAARPSISSKVNCSNSQVKGSRVWYSAGGDAHILASLAHCTCARKTALVMETSAQEEAWPCSQQSTQYHNPLQKPTQNPE